MTQPQGQGRAVQAESTETIERAEAVESTVQAERAVVVESTVQAERAAADQESTEYDERAVIAESIEKLERAVATESTAKAERVCAPVLFLTLLLTLAAPVLAAEQPPQRPYSCRQLDDQQRRCAFDPRCDRRVTERLTRECWRDGGRP